jgi:hypothetical protein
MKVTMNSRQFMRDMTNIMEYSTGFLEGIHRGKAKFLVNLGAATKELLKEYIDSTARVNPTMLHHIYEWNQVGSPDARLFDIDYTVSGLGLSFKGTFRQSTTVKDGSKTPFYDKARIMEEGSPISIRPVKAQALSFEDGGETVFVKSEVTVENPGGPAVQGGFEKAFDSFFNRFFSQAFLKVSGVSDYLEDPVLYKSNFARGKRGGRVTGIETGNRWIANAGVIN